MNTINTNPPQSTSSETVKNIVDMFNQLTPDNKEIVLNHVRQMAESNVPKRSTASEIPPAKKNSSPENSFISALYSSIIEDKRNIQAAHSQLWRIRRTARQRLL